MPAFLDLYNRLIFLLRGSPPSYRIFEHRFAVAQQTSARKVVALEHFYQSREFGLVGEYRRIHRRDSWILPSSFHGHFEESLPNPLAAQFGLQRADFQAKARCERLLHPAIILVLTLNLRIEHSLQIAFGVIDNVAARVFLSLVPEPSAEIAVHRLQTVKKRVVQIQLVKRSRNYICHNALF